jgi:branched-subunit amino acid aminotransferase/4-amino-4-deoxychorismate lyase
LVSSSSNQVQKAQLEAKARGFSDVVYVDALEKKYVEEVSSCNVFLVKVIPDITRSPNVMHALDKECM